MKTQREEDDAGGGRVAELLALEGGTVDEHGHAEGGLAGPPWVSRYGSSKSCAALMKDVTTTKAVTGLSAGRVTVVNWRNCPGAVQLGRLVQLAGDVLQPGEEEDGEVPHPAPEQHEADGDLGQGRIAQPVQRRRPEQGLQRGVEQPEVLVQASGCRPGR